MNRKEFEETLKIGDTVTIRDWDDMADEFEAPFYADFIRTPAWTFISDMREYCGCDFIIEGKKLYEGEIKSRPEGIYEFNLRTKSGEHNPYYWTADMFELPSIYYLSSDLWNAMILEGVQNDM